MAATKLTGPVAALGGKGIDQLRRLFKPGRATPQLMAGIATFLDDQHGGVDDRIDAGLEALHLATFLLNEAQGALLPRHRLGREVIVRYRDRALPRARSTRKLASQLRYDVEGGTLTRGSHHGKTARYWKPHFIENKRRILRAVALMKRRRGRRPGRPRVMVLGAGSCADIPLKEMVAAGCDVTLVDLDEASLKQGIAMQLAPAARRHVQLEIRDLSEGVVDAVSQAATRVIKRHAAGPPARARAAMNALFKRQRVSVPQLEGGERVDLLLSSLLIGQLPVIPAKAIGGWFARRFKEPLVNSDAGMLAQSDFGDKLFDAHIEALSDFVIRSRAVVYFSSDLYLTPSFYEISSGKERYGPSSPVMGHHGKPVEDLDRPFENNPALELISRSLGQKAGSDFWIWNQVPAQLAKDVSSVKMRSGDRVIVRRGKKGMVRAIDSVILIPAQAPKRPRGK